MARPCLERAQAQRLELDPPQSVPPDAFARQHHAGLGKTLQACRDVGRVADRGVVHPKVVTDLADHDCARVQPDAQSQALPGADDCG